MIAQDTNPSCRVRTHFYHDASTFESLCDRRVVERNFTYVKRIGATSGNVHVSCIVAPKASRYLDWFRNVSS